MNKEELLKKFRDNVDYLYRNIPPDDIYVFAEQTFMACIFFLHKWSEFENLDQACKHDDVAAKWVKNIIAFQILKEKNLPVTLDLNLESLEDGQNT